MLNRSLNTAVTHTCKKCRNNKEHYKILINNVVLPELDYIIYIIHKNQKLQIEITVHCTCHAEVELQRWSGESGLGIVGDECMALIQQNSLVGPRVGLC